MGVRDPQESQHTDVAQGQSTCLQNKVSGYRNSPSVPNAEVAQLVRASVSYAEGQRFDPAPRYKKYNLIIRNFIINFFIVVF